jgi:hypothetical protein
LLYVCDHLPGNGTHVVHLTFEARRADGMVGDIAAGADTRPIRGVEFVKLCDLPALGFGGRFAELAAAGFPDAGSYMGPKSAIGLWQRGERVGQCPVEDLQWLTAVGKELDPAVHDVADPVRDNGCVGALITRRRARST